MAVPDVEQYNPMDATDLYRALSRFFDDNKSHHTVERRWLAQQVISLRLIAHDLGTNGIASFQKKYSQELAELRLIEIEDKRREIAKVDNQLDEEAKRLKRQTSQAA